MLDPVYRKHYTDFKAKVMEKKDSICAVDHRTNSPFLYHKEHGREELFEMYNIKTKEDALACKELWDMDNFILLCATHARCFRQSARKAGFSDPIYHNASKMTEMRNSKCVNCKAVRSKDTPNVRLYIYDKNRAIPAKELIDGNEYIVVCRKCKKTLKPFVYEFGGYQFTYDEYLDMQKKKNIS